MDISQDNQFKEPSARHAESDIQQLQDASIPQPGLEVRSITPQEYAELAARLDLNPLLSAGFLRRLESRSDEVRLYGGFEEGELVIAAAGRFIPAWKIFKWLDFPFGVIAARWNDASLYENFAHGIDALEETDSLLFMQMDLMLQERSFDENGAPTEAFSNLPLREDLEAAGFEFLPPLNGRSSSGQAQFASQIQLSSDAAMYKGGPVDLLALEDATSYAMKSPEQLRLEMEEEGRSQVDQACKPCFKVRLLSKDEAGLLDHLRSDAWDNAPLDLSFLDAYPDQSALVCVLLDVAQYRRDFDQRYELENQRVQQFFENAQSHPKDKKASQQLMDQLGAVRLLDEEQERLKAMEALQVKEIPMAAGLYLFNQLETLCLWSGEDPEYAWLPGKAGMHWFMMDWSSKRRALRYTFWGLNGGYANGGKGYSDYAFNKSLGADVVKFMGTVRMPFKKSSAKLYSSYLRQRNLQG